MNDRNPLVSIIIPVYNVELYIEKCLFSVTNQSYKHLEIIIVNDGSTDNSEDIILNFQKKDKRIIYIKRKNGGLGAARNTGIEISSGKYICFVDSDDWIDLNYIKIMLQTAITDKSEIVICNMVYQYSDGTIKPRTPKILFHEIISPQEGIKRELIGKQYKFHMPNKFCKTDLFKKYHIIFPEGKIYEDVFTTYKLFLEATSISLISDDLYFYLQDRVGSIMNNKIEPLRISNMFEALDQIISNEIIVKMELNDELQLLYSTHVISLANYIYPLWGNEPKNKLLEYQKKITKNLHCNLLDLATKNNNINLMLRIRIFMIQNHFLFYCFLMKNIKKLLKNK